MRARDFGHLQRPILFLVAGMLWSFGCSAIDSRTTPETVGAPPLSRAVPKDTKQEIAGVQIGTASWYGPNFSGKRTASGELFNQEALTAAHPTLPLGTRVRVTRIDTNRSVEVEINDRGPFVEGRIIDLSLGGARALGMIEDGTVPVRVEVMKTPRSGKDLSRTH